MLEWAISEGTVMKATISRNKEGVRGLFATEPIKEGDVILDVPEHIVLSVKNVGAAVSPPCTACITGNWEPDMQRPGMIGCSSEVRREPCSQALYARLCAP